MKVKRIKLYKTKEGKEPYREWFLGLDNSQKATIMTRLKRVELGNYGYYKKLSGGISELKFDNGLRIYFSEFEKVIILLLVGGDKRRQSSDINKAEEYYNDYISRSKEDD